jgi:uncharacterized repeat protein (TIGR03943 family)
MSRPAQGLLVTLVGGTLMWISLATGAHLNYVKPYYQPALIVTGAVLVALGLVTLARQWQARATGHSTPTSPVPCCPAPTFGDAQPADSKNGPEGHGNDQHGQHGHKERGPRVAWLLGLPVLAIFLLAPPALGSYAAGRDAAPAVPPPGRSKYEPLPVLDNDQPNDLYIGEFIGRSHLDGGKTLSGRKVRLLGFVTPREHGGWYLTRIQISCCAADARAWKIHIRGAPKPATDSWVHVTGTWIPRKPGDDPTIPPQLAADTIRTADRPDNAYEEFN